MSYHHTEATYNENAWVTGSADRGDGTQSTERPEPSAPTPCPLHSAQGRNTASLEDQKVQKQIQQCLVTFLCA